MSIQARKSNAVEVSSICLNLPDAEGVTLSELPADSIPFTIQLEQLIHFDDIVKEFGGVIGQNGALINIGDYVELSSAHYQVRYN